MIDAIIVGAGFAGLSAAVAMARAGARVLVVEARGKPGGRATSFVDRATGEVVDNGQHVLFGCYRETLRFLEAIGARDRLRLDSSLTVPMILVSGQRTHLACPPLLPPWHLLGGLLGWEALGWRDRIAVLRVAPALQAARRAVRRGDTRRLAPAGLTVDAWLGQHGQTRRLRDLLWEPLAVAALNQSPRDAEADPFVRVLALMFGERATDAAVALPTVPLDRMYAEPAIACLAARGVEVRCGRPARLLFGEGRVRGVRLGEEEIAGRLVIATVPWFALRDLVGPLEGAAASLQLLVDDASRLRSLPIVTVNLWFDRPVMREAFVGLPGRRMQWVFDRRFIAGGASHLSIVSSGATDIVGLDGDALVRLAAREIRDALPSARAATLRHALAVREKRATFSLAPGEPPRPGTATPLTNLLLAGDWIATGLPGTIESAVMSGHSAAAAALAALESI